jgi:hypothetical protein
MTKKEFIEEIFELAFGDDAVNKGYSYEEVVLTLREFSDTALEIQKQQQ